VAALEARIAAPKPAAASPPPKKTREQLMDEAAARDFAKMQQGVRIQSRIGFSRGPVLVTATAWFGLASRLLEAATKKSSFCCPERVHAERAGTGCARAVGMQIQIMNAGTRPEIDAAFETIARARHDALLVGSDTFFRGRGAASLALHQKIERVQMPNALYHRTADRLRPSGCYGSSAGTSGCAGSSP